MISFDGKPIDQVGQLSRAVAVVEPGTKAELVVWRDGKEMKLEADDRRRCRARTRSRAPSRPSRVPISRKLGLALAAD